MSGTELDNAFPGAKLFHRQHLGPGVWRLRKYCILVRKRAERDLMGSFKPTTYLREELQQLASAKFEEAAALPDGPRREQLLKEFVAANDDAAFEHARQFVDTYDVELWNSGRFVSRSSASCRAS
jgi:hypothetical protein